MTIVLIGAKISIKQGGVVMNPFKVNKVIEENNMNDKQICIDTLGELCGGRIRHAYLRMSNETFLCKESNGFPRHWVEGLKLHSWFTLWFYHPPKIEETEYGEPTDENA